MDADGMITNYPDRLISILNEEEFSSKFRLATYDDSPWDKYTFKTARLISDEDEFRNEAEEILYNC